MRFMICNFAVNCPLCKFAGHRYWLLRKRFSRDHVGKIRSVAVVWLTTEAATIDLLSTVQLCRQTPTLKPWGGWLKTPAQPSQFEPSRLDFRTWILCHILSVDTFRHRGRGCRPLIARTCSRGTTWVSEVRRIEPWSLVTGSWPAVIYDRITTDWSWYVKVSLHHQWIVCVCWFRSMTQLRLIFKSTVEKQLASGNTSLQFIQHMT